MPMPSDLRVGDVLVQHKGEPWVSGCRLICGYPYPHARVVSKTSGSEVWIIESGKPWDKKVAGVNEYVLPGDLDSFEIWRPNCDAAIKYKAIEWMRAHVGEMYAYSRMLQILVLRGEINKGTTPGLDDDPAFDNNPKVCSELIAMGFYRAGYDLVPLVSNRATMPWDLRNPKTMTLLA